MLHNLNGKIMDISHDNATNIKNAVKIFHEQDIYSNRCTTYTLQLAVKKFFRFKYMSFVIKNSP